MRNFIITICLLCLIIAPISTSYADSNGVLSETELNEWLSAILKQSVNQTPLNAPIDENALTEQGYAFLYSFATLYYDKPVLDSQSILNAVTLTQPGAISPKNIALGDSGQKLMDCYGWQNPMLLGDGQMAALYKVDKLPQAAYWCLAQHKDDVLNNLQCALHIQTPNGKYTDAGIVYKLENNVITDIQVYGLNFVINLEEVKNNLNSIAQLQAFGSGDSFVSQTITPSYFTKQDLPIFSKEDYILSDVLLEGQTEDSITKHFGEATSSEHYVDDLGQTMLNTTRDGLSLSYTAPKGSSAFVLDMVSVSSPNYIGPRGIAIGMPLTEVIAKFNSNGRGNHYGNAALLYGDGIQGNYSLMEKVSKEITTVQYVTTLQDNKKLSLSLTFKQDILSEMLLYFW